MGRSMGTFTISSNRSIAWLGEKPIPRWARVAAKRVEKSSINLTSSNNSRVTQLEAGKTYERADVV